MTERTIAMGQATPVLKCCASSLCWCNRLKYRFPMEGRECLSPEQILYEYGDVLESEDKNYLMSLMRYKFENS